ncbi:hypothetical protein JT358_12815 [Micrococcales bacterium 31B]|nr:hypothetical protein [Micrococcales bacterium 31B]
MSTVLLAAFAAAAVTRLAASIQVSFFSAFGGAGLQVSLSYLMPLVAVIALCYGLDAKHAATEATAVRRVAALDVGLVLVCVAVFAVTIGTSWVAWPTEPGGAWQAALGDDVFLASVRNLAGFAGIACLTAVFLPRRLSALMAVGYALLAILSGVHDGNYLWWAFVVNPGDDTVAAIMATACLAAGCVTLARGDDSRRRLGAR